MPLLRRCFEEVGHVFDGLRVAMCLHIEPKTAVLCRLLAQHGAIVGLTGSPGTTRPETAEALAADGVQVYSSRNDDGPRVHQVLELDPHLILDNGADLILAVLAGGRTEALRGATEETTTGGILLRNHPITPDFPVVVINDSPLKLMVENRFGVGQSVVQGFMNATNLMLPGSRATVVGYGPCGRGTAETLRHLGATVTVVDTDPYQALLAHLEGFGVGDLADTLPTTRLLFLATGREGVIGRAEIALLDDGVVVAGVGHRPWELDLASLGPVVDHSGYYQTHRQPDGRRVHVLAANRMLNLVAGLGNPIEAMDLGLTLQARSLAAIATGDVPAGIHPVPADIDRQVARDFLTARTRAPRA
jgi:adenosylhomocysteinase